MILNMLYILSGYLILSISWVDSYVLLAANIDDFRNIASRIIPGHLANQLANMAAVKGNMKHNFDKDYEDDNSDNDNSDGSTEDTSIEDYFYRTQNPLKIEGKERASKEIYKLNNENIDLDELVKRVKDKLESDYQLTPNSKNFANNKHGSVTTGKEEIGKLEDYYYKDENLNDDYKNVEYTDVKKKPLNSAVTTESNAYDVVQDYDGVNIYYTEEQNNTPDYSVKNIKTDYDQQNVKKKFVTLKDTREDDNKEKKLEQFDEYGNVTPNQESENVQKYTKAQVYYKDNEQTLQSKYPKRLQVISNVKTPKDTYADIDMQPDLQKTPVYYDESSNNMQVKVNTPKDGEIFKGVDMLKPLNDSYEDYVTPKKDNIFESDEHTTQKSMRPIRGEKTDNNVKSRHSRPKAFMEPQKIENQNDVIKPPAAVKIIQPELIKAKTAMMWYKDPNIENYDDSKTEKQEGVKTTKHLRTLFPTKTHIKISSPNYFAKLPAVAEKYNFDEPIPEEDREPELIKPIGNPPAMINKKVKL